MYPFLNEQKTGCSNREKRSSPPAARWRWTTQNFVGLFVCCFLFLPQLWRLKTNCVIGPLMSSERRSTWQMLVQSLFLQLQTIHKQFNFARTSGIWGSQNMLSLLWVTSASLYLARPAGPHPDISTVDDLTTGEVKCRVPLPSGMDRCLSRRLQFAKTVKQYDIYNNLYIGQC